MRNLLRNPWRIGWLLAAWLLMALSLGALSDCRADRTPPPPPPRATATSVPVTPSPVPPPPPATATPLLTPSLFEKTCSERPGSGGLGGTATVGVGEASIPPGRRALVPITVANVTNPRGLGAYQMCVTFDPGVVRVVTVAGGDPPFQSVADFNIDNAEGWVSVVGFQAATLNGPRRPITVAHLNLEAVGDWGAITTLELHVTELFDTNGDSMAATEFNGEVLVDWP